MRKKKKLRYKLYSLLLIFISAVFVFVNYVQYLRYKNLDEHAKQILDEVNKEDDRQKQLNEQIKSYDNDQYIEKVAREKLGMVKSDEIIFYYDNGENWYGPSFYKSPRQN